MLLPDRYSSQLEARHSFHGAIRGSTRHLNPEVDTLLSIT